ncbi:MAG: penicillin acylase family protein [Acidobacteriia bacterium]|nr:penicillin acylase family protein [Terriglobia bacterium]
MSVTASLPEVRRRNPALRILYYAFCVLLAALIGGLWWLVWIARSPLPQLDGSVSVHGVSAKVRVVRDEHGVPTIEAATLDDLFFAQGYVTAQDRLWQMDLMRRAAGGELSEIIGEDTVKMDREQRILGLRVAAETAEKTISARDHAYFEDYARGVNAFLASHRDRLSLEFRLMKYQPRPWTVTDSLLIGARLVQDLNHYSYARALTREKILAKLGPELTADLYVNWSWRDRPPTDLRRGMADEPGAGSGDEDEEDEEEVDPSGETNHLISARAVAGLTAAEDDLFRSGSNNWVVSGQHTVTGKPLLSNDMHLGHQMPNLWFEAHLKSGSFDVAGVTLPGVPFVIVGHNQRIGWGFTNVGPTVEDDYIEEFNERGQYKAPTGWRDPERRQEVIHVKGKPDVTLEVVTTRHGPIISELVPGETRKIALRWTLYDGMGLPFFDVNAATNWEEFRKAFSGFAAAGQNAMYGDVDGHIGYQATGRVPIRAAGDGSLPVAGSDDAHEWKSYIPFDDLPRVFDPPTGILATANGRIAPDKYKYSISTEWDAPWRTDRIYRVLESGKKFAPADMLALQMDVSSTLDRFCADKFVYALDHAANTSSRAKRAADILRDWDGRMTADSAAPTIESKSRQELVRLLLEPKLGPAPAGPPNFPPNGELNWKSYRWSMSTVWVEAVLTKQPTRWLPPGYPDYETLLAAAVENALKQPGVPADVGEWKWGKNYPVEINHLVLSRLPLIGRWTGPGLRALSGSASTVKAVGRDFGPSERLTWNFANFDESTLNIVTGESGIFLSPYYMDQWRAWYGGTTFGFPFSKEAVEQHKQHAMTLE